MSDSLPENEQLLNDDLGLKLLDSHKYWGKKRFLFNVLVGIAGLFSVFYFGFGLSGFDLLGILMWGVVANAFYSFGYVLDSQVIVGTKGGKSLEMYRPWLFWFGTIAYVLATIEFASEYFTNLT